MKIRLLRLLALAGLLGASSPAPLLAEHWFRGPVPMVEASYVNEKLSRPHKIYSLDLYVAREGRSVEALRNRVTGL